MTTSEIRLLISFSKGLMRVYLLLLPLPEFQLRRVPNIQRRVPNEFRRVPNFQHLLVLKLRPLRLNSRVLLLRNFQALNLPQALNLSPAA